MEEIQNTKTIKAALLGVGTVGSGVYELVRERQDDFINICGVRIEIAKILVRDTSKSREGIPSSLLTDKWEEIIRDDEISVIIEVIIIHIVHYSASPYYRLVCQFQLRTSSSSRL